MKILQAIETGGPGGAEQVVLQMCRGLRKSGHEVEGLLMKDGWLADRFREEGFDFAVIPMERALDRRFLARIRDHLDARRPDVLHTHEFTFALYGRWASRSREIRHVATAHGKNFCRGIKRRVLDSLTFRGGRRFALVAVSRDLADHLAQETWLPERSIRVIANGIPLAEDREPPSRRPDEPLRLVAVGNLYPVKNHGFSIRCVARMLEAGIPVELDILGRGDEEPALRELIDELGVDDSVRLQGFRSDVDRFLDRAHLLLSSSLSEGMPMSFLEAMARALPVVSSHVGGVAEIVEHEERGLLFPSGSLDEAVAALGALAADDSRRLRLGRQARQYVRENHSLDHVVGEYARLYDELSPRQAAGGSCSPPASQEERHVSGR